VVSVTDPYDRILGFLDRGSPLFTAFISWFVVLKLFFVYLMALSTAKLHKMTGCSVNTELEGMWKEPLMA
jgi:hypothetical protein